ncbi:DUF1345 domain-containing protein [uncultured Amnibacterium sp.]|uniref:DUF1345 domain-containing protein n=1 Tax=uncultured Amnibacterium sp. TaxID=1631851 RepID=UPI0035CB994B
MTGRAEEQARRTTAGGYLATAVELVVVLSAVLYAVVGTTAALVTWEVLAVLYLLVGAAYAVLDGRRVAIAGRRGPLGVMSWLLPVTASVAGIYSAVLALADVPRASGGPMDQATTVTLAATAGIIVSWLLLHVGFAQIYQESFDGHPDQPGLRFPDTPEPRLLDFLYFSFAIGAAFATSDTQVTVGRMRRTVLLHSVLGFFYNALVVAVAFDVLQRLTTA